MHCQHTRLTSKHRRSAAALAAVAGVADKNCFFCISPDLEKDVLRGATWPKLSNDNYKLYQLDCVPLRS